MPSGCLAFREPVYARDGKDERKMARSTATTCTNKLALAQLMRSSFVKPAPITTPKHDRFSSPAPFGSLNFTVRAEYTCRICTTPAPLPFDISRLRSVFLHYNGGHLARDAPHQNMLSSMAITVFLAVRPLSCPGETRTKTTVHEGRYFAHKPRYFYPFIAVAGQMKL